MPLSDLVAAHREQLNRLEESAYAALLGPYRQAAEEILERLDALVEAEEDDTFTADHLRAILAQVEDALNEMVTVQTEDFDGEFTAAMELGAGQMLSEVADLEGTFGSEDMASRIRAIAPVIPAETVANLADPTKLLLHRFRERLYVDVARELAVAVTLGEGGRTAAERLEGVIERREHELLRIARTEINNAANAGHDRAIVQVNDVFPELDVRRQWSTRIDGRESDICRALHRMVRRPGEAFSTVGMAGIPLWTGMHPPAHPNCRSRVVPWRQAWVDFERENDIPKSASYGAQVKVAYVIWGGCGPECDHEEEHPMGIRTKSKAPEIKNLAMAEFKMLSEAEGTFTGYAAVYGNIDSHGDIIAPGAFKESLDELRREGKMVPILWQHDTDVPIGVCDPNDMEEDETGLRIKKGQLAITTPDEPGVPKADEARRLMKMKALQGLSVGYETKKRAEPTKEEKAQGAKRRLVKMDLWEFSPVTFPSNDQAGYDGVKSVEGKAADMNTLLDINQRRSELWSRKWKIESALEDANHLAMCDENLSREGKIAQITTNLAQYTQAMVGWFSDQLTLKEDAKAAGVETKAAPGAAEAKAGKTLSAATRTSIQSALDGMAAAKDALEQLMTTSDKPAEDDAAATETKTATPTPPAGAGNPTVQTAPESKTTDALTAMRQADALSRMKAAF